jgi:hypothetical protein
VAGITIGAFAVGGIWYLFRSTSQERTYVFVDQRMTTSGSSSSDTTPSLGSILID